MDTTTLVALDWHEGQRALDRLAGEGIPIRAACLLKLQDRIKPSLYIATPLLDQKGPLEAYRDVLAPLTSLDGMLDALDVSLVGESHSLVRDVRSVLRRAGGGFLMRDLSTFGGLPVEQVYVYPPSEAFPGFNQIRQQFPSAEVFTVDVPRETLVPSGQLPNPALLSLVGKVNATEFEGRSPETLYFVGPRASWEDKVSQLVFAYRPEGWNTMFDGEAKQWRKVVVASTNRPLYEPADFTPLLELKAPPTVASA